MLLHEEERPGALFPDAFEVVVLGMLDDFFSVVLLDEEKHEGCLFEGFLQVLLPTQEAGAPVVSEGVQAVLEASSHVDHLKGSMRSKVDPGSGGRRISSEPAIPSGRSYGISVVSFEALSPRSTFSGASSPTFPWNLRQFGVVRTSSEVVSSGGSTITGR